MTEFVRQLEVDDCSFTGSPTYMYNAFPIGSLRWSGAALRVWHLLIYGSSVAPLWLFSVVAP